MCLDSCVTIGIFHRRIEMDEREKSVSQKMDIKSTRASNELVHKEVKCAERTAMAQRTTHNAQ